MFKQLMIQICKLSSKPGKTLKGHNFNIKSSDEAPANQGRVCQQSGPLPPYHGTGWLSACHCSSDWLCYPKSCYCVSRKCSRPLVLLPSQKLTCCTNESEDCCSSANMCWLLKTGLKNSGYKVVIVLIGWILLKEII